jgi:hypothetical protein
MKHQLPVARNVEVSSEQREDVNMQQPRFELGIIVSMVVQGYWWLSEHWASLMEYYWSLREQIAAIKAQPS